jgi:ABC-type sugar transport system substrate-binding protein
MHTFARRSLLAVALLPAALFLAGCGTSEPPATTKLRVGFAQIGAESDWRKANSESIKNEAAKRGIELSSATRSRSRRTRSRRCAASSRRRST